MQFENVSLLTKREPLGFPSGTPCIAEIPKDSRDLIVFDDLQGHALLLFAAAPNVFGALAFGLVVRSG